MTSSAGGSSCRLAADPMLVQALAHRAISAVPKPVRVCHQHSALLLRPKYSPLTLAVCVYARYRMVNVVSLRFPFRHLRSYIVAWHPSTTPELDARKFLLWTGKIHSVRVTGRMNFTSKEEVWNRSRELWAA